MKLRLPPAVQINVGALIADDGDDLTPGPAVTPMTVPLADLKGCKFYDTLLAEMHTWASDVQDGEPTETPLRAVAPTSA